MRLRIAAALGAVILAAAGATAVVLSHSATPADGRGQHRCDRIASPRGRAHVHGTITGVRRLVKRLRPGQTGCLHAGRYRHDLILGRSRIGLRSYPGELAHLIGRLWITRTAHDDVISDLRLNGRNPARLPSPTVNGDRISFLRDDVTNDHTAICFDIGSEHYGRAEHTTIRDSRIHGCGMLPPRNLEHGVYVAAADDTRIIGNVIYGNADRGIQLYPDAQHTLIAGNVIDSNGEGVIFSGLGHVASSHNEVVDNVISNSRVRANVESFYPPGTAIGVGNVVRHNCLFGGQGGPLPAVAEGFTATENLYVDPGYVDAAAQRYRLAGGSPCAGLLAAGRRIR